MYYYLQAYAHQSELIYSYFIVTDLFYLHLCLIVVSACFIAVFTNVVHILYIVVNKNNLV